MNLQTGAFGDPSRKETLILFWSKMEALHYPLAAETKAFLEEQLQKELEQVQQQAAMQQAMQMQAMQQAAPFGAVPDGGAGQGMATPGLQ